MKGACAQPSAVLVDGAGARIVGAAELWGLPAAEAERQLRDRLGQGWRIAANGRPASAASGTPPSRTMGGTPGAAAWARCWAPSGSRRSRSARLPRSGRPTRKRCWPPRATCGPAPSGQATAKYRELGTLADLLAFNALAALPTRNFQAASFAAAPQLAAEELASMRKVARHSCASCTIGCEHIYKAPGGKKMRAEYQNVFALGPMCGVSDPDAVLAAGARCDELGLDTISAGGTIAWAMECAERGLIDAPWLRFGDPSALLRALTEIGERRGLGDLLAEGSRRAAAQVGGGSAAFAPQVKGLELPGYEPRTLQAMALGLAVNARGADHNRSGAYAVDLSGDHDRLAGGAAQVAGAIETEDRAAVMDSLILCNFLRGVFTEPFAEWAALLAAVTGWPIDEAELRQTARRIVLAKRAFNIREGWQPADDWLPERLLSEPVRLTSGRVAALTPDGLRAMIDAYYAARGLDPQGHPDPSDVADLQLA